MQGGQGEQAEGVRPEGRNEAAISPGVGSEADTRAAVVEVEAVTGKSSSRPVRMLSGWDRLRVDCLASRAGIPHFSYERYRMHVCTIGPKRLLSYTYRVYSTKRRHMRSTREISGCPRRRQAKGREATGRKPISGRAIGSEPKVRGLRSISGVDGRARSNFTTRRDRLWCTVYQRGHTIVQLLTPRRGRRGRIVQKGETKFGARTMTYQIADSLRRLGLALAAVSLTSAWKLVQSVKD